MNLIIFGGVIFILALVKFREWFFGRRTIDDRQGFPYSRRRGRRRGG
jgi:hypothetical protein